MATYVILTRTRWKEIPRARHQVAQALQKHGDIIFIESNNFGWPSIEEKKIETNLLLFTQSFPISSKLRFRLPFINELYQMLVLFHLKKRNINNSYVINFDHTFWLLPFFFKATIYYCNDNHIRKNGNKAINKYFKFTEMIVSKKAKFTVSTSQSLQNKLVKFNKASYFIPLGGPTPILKKVNYATNKIKLALIGFIDSNRIDMNVLSNIINIGSIELHIWGKVEKHSLDEYLLHDNIFIHPIKVGSQLLLELQNCSVGIAPYVKKNINSGGTPNKLWQYLAAGLPVVVTELHSNSFSCPNHVLVSKQDNSDFINLVQKASKMDTTELLLERFELAKQNTWEKRIEELLKIIDKDKCNN